MSVLYVTVKCAVCDEELGKRAKAKECTAHCKGCEITWYYRPHELRPYAHRRDGDIKDIKIPVRKRKPEGWQDPRYGGKDDPEWDK